MISYETREKSRCTVMNRLHILMMIEIMIKALYRPVIIPVPLYEAYVAIICVMFFSLNI